MLKIGPLHVSPFSKEPIIIHTESGREIARVTLSGYKVGHEPSYLEWAALLAAAPDLLAALSRLAGLADGRVNGDDADEMCAWAEALQEAQAAILKAREVKP